VERGPELTSRSAGALAVLVALAVSAIAPPAGARSLQAVRERGVVSLCAHANALPFSSKQGNPAGFQIELATALAAQLGVRLVVEWVTSGFQFRSVDCDLILDSIAVPEAQAERNIVLSKPYQRSGVALAVRSPAGGIAGFADLDGHRRVAVLSGSLAAMILGRRGVQVASFGFEDEMVEAVARGEVDAAAVSPASVGYFNLTHPDRAVRLVHAYDAEPELAWDLAVGLRRSDPPLREAIDAALDRLLADGTVQRIYARYGIEHRPPPRPAP
jgi:polar amino acid transport system substrate-binding protein